MRSTNTTNLYYRKLIIVRLKILDHHAGKKWHEYVVILQDKCKSKLLTRETAGSRTRSFPSPPPLLPNSPKAIQKQKTWKTADISVNKLHQLGWPIKLNDADN